MRTLGWVALFVTLVGCPAHQKPKGPEDELDPGNIPRRPRPTPILWVAVARPDGPAVC